MKTRGLLRQPPGRSPLKSFAEDVCDRAAGEACAPPRRTHHRRPHSVGADAHIGPLGTGIKSTIAERTRRGARIRSRVRFTQRWRSMYPVPAACGHAALRPQRPANCLAHGGWRADVGVGPYEKNRRPTAEAGPGGHKARPYGKTGSGSVGADFISARAARPRRTHHRRTHSVGADAHIGPLGAGIKSTIAERTRRGARIRSRVRFTQRWRSMYPVPAACGHAALRPQRPANCLAHGGWRADVGIGPYEKNHRTSARNGNWFRAAIQAAPTRGAGIRPDSGPFRSDGAQSADGARWTSRWSPHSR